MNDDNVNRGRDLALIAALEESAQAQDEAASVLKVAARKLTELGIELRRHGRFPLADQIEREGHDLAVKAEVVNGGG